MAEPIDAYSDQFIITTTPFGANLSFFVNTPHPEQAKVVPAERVATIRMSNEHLKVMTTIMARQVKKMERDSGVKTEVDPRILMSLGIAREDWDKLWEL
jgi:hypothetical protein